MDLEDWGLAACKPDPLGGLGNKYMPRQLPLGQEQGHNLAGRSRPLPAIVRLLLKKAAEAQGVCQQ